MFDDGIKNLHEHAHQTGLRKGFDLGWSYKGKFDRTLIQDMIKQLNPERDHDKIECLTQALELLRTHKNNREFITDNWS